jgi:DNA-directed RNA polymerase subunit alpha
MSHEIILPSQFVTVLETPTNGVYEIGGLYPGYGHTLGNSLRRVIYSSLPGVAVTQVAIEGVEHEFSAMTGMKEDVLNLVLNIKKLRARLVGVDEAVVELKVKGPKVVTAKDIVTDASVELINADEYLCELTDKVSLNVTITFSSGIGFRTRDEVRREKLPAGTIVLDSVFSPLRRVSYEVDNMRVGDRTDYNSLRVSIETDGTITPRFALEESLRIMIAQLRSIANLKEEEFTVAAAPAISESSAASEMFADDENDDASADVLKTRIDSLSFSTRVMNALSEANIRTLGGLVRKGEEDLLALDGFGAKGLDEVKEILGQFDLKLKE